MKRICIYISSLFVLIASSCGSARKATTSQEVASSAVTSIDSTALRREIESIVQERLDIALELEHAEELEILQERFSKPDSCGNTHLEEKVTTRYNSTTKAQSTQASAQETNVVAKNQVDTLYKTSTAVIAAQEEEMIPQQPKGIPGIVKVFSWIGVAAVLALLVYILIKLKVICR